MTTSSAHLFSARTELRRELFTVSGVRVTFDGKAWQCGCFGCAPNVRCTHIEQALRFRQLRCSRPETQPIQFGVDGPDFRVPDARVSSTHSLPPDEAWATPKRHIFRGRSAAAIAAVFAGAVFSISAYLSIDSAPVVAAAPVAAPRLPPLERRAAAHRPVPPAVKVTNPFDPSETFEFPAGTSDVQAQESAATLLLERARQRMAAAAEHKRAM